MRQSRNGPRGSALGFVYQRWEAVFRRERRPLSLDRVPGVFLACLNLGNAADKTPFPSVQRRKNEYKKS